MWLTNFRTFVASKINIRFGVKQNTFFREIISLNCEDKVNLNYFTVLIDFETYFSCKIFGLMWILNDIFNKNLFWNLKVLTDTFLYKENVFCAYNIKTDFNVKRTLMSKSVRYRITEMMQCFHNSLQIAFASKRNRFTEKTDQFLKLHNFRCKKACQVIHFMARLKKVRHHWFKLLKQRMAYILSYCAFEEYI